MLVYHILASLVILGTIVGLWWLHRERFLFIDALLGLLLFELLQAALANWNLLAAGWLLIGLRLLAWGVLLAAATQVWRVVATVLVVLLIIAALPFVPGANFLMWGYLTAVPLLALLTILPQQDTKLPIIAPSAQAASLRPVRMADKMSTDMVESQRPILESLVDGIIFSGQTGLIDYANQAATIMLGISIDEMLGHPVTDILAHVPMLGGSANINHFEKNGRILQGQMSLIYDSEGVAQGTVAVLRDITAQYHAETSRDEFLTTVSHELRTPLTAIKGYVELLASGTGGQISANQKSFLNTIQRNVNRMVQLINSLIFATTIRSGRLEYGTGPTDLARLIDQLAREMQPKAAQSGQQITTELHENLAPIQADPMHMETIISELLQNAMKYNRQGGNIHVRALLEGNGSVAPTFAVVSIRDDGVGIATEDWDRIFEEFYRPDKSTSQVQAGGMGMGLSIVRALVEAYNGRIWFDSVPDQGSTFTFIIPINQPTEISLS
jgi:signal transduction histidine kinase